MQLKNKIITIRVVGLGLDRTIELLEGNCVKDLRIYCRKREGDSFHRDGKRLSLNTILKNGDVIIYAQTIRGSATMSRAGKKWRIHKTDKDNFPSNFHAHNYDDREVLDLYTGIIYSTTTKKQLCGLAEKEYKSLLKDLSGSKEEEFNIKAKSVLSKQN